MLLAFVFSFCRWKECPVVDCGCVVVVVVLLSLQMEIVHPDDHVLFCNFHFVVRHRVLQALFLLFCPVVTEIPQYQDTTAMEATLFKPPRPGEHRWWDCEMPDYTVARPSGCLVLCRSFVFHPFICCILLNLVRVTLIDIALEFKIRELTMADEMARMRGGGV